VRVEHNASLKPYNSFNLDVTASILFHLEDPQDLESYRLHPDGYAKHALLISGGSNILLCQAIDGSVARINWQGKSIRSENDSHAIIEVQAGENWHDFVQWSIDQGFGGLENLSLIPGLVGTAPVQNIGAYGVEVANLIESVTYMQWNDGKTVTLPTNDCQFSYRSSLFKTTLKDKVVIQSVTFKLSKETHDLCVSYGAIQAELEGKAINPRSIADAVISIRQSKLPDPKILGNSGSFFKNPILSQGQVDGLLLTHPDMPHYPQENGLCKVAAGWLIEQTGWKGKRMGDAGMHDKQALVLVNHGRASGKDLWDVAVQVKADVKQQFNIDLTPEVNVIGD
jgi:UDP-N-acetylmuramate dehydrogenase